MPDKTQTRHFALSLIPPILYPIILNSVNKIGSLTGKGSFQQMAYNPTWNTVEQGFGKGLKIYLDKSAIGTSEEMVSGTYDDYFFNSLQKHKPKGKIIFDIGTHIGYNALVFAKMVGTKGKVVAFEPNTFNRERLEMNVAKNSEIAERITVEGYALGDKEGTADFLMTNTVDGGSSSGSFLDDAHTNMEHSMYEKELGFQRVKTKIITLDGYIKKQKVKPDFLKIDVEGAEQLVLKGAETTLSKLKPIIYMEVHSIFSALKVAEQLTTFKYRVEVIHEEQDGRCFILAK